ncbi:MAG: ATP-dependent DNA helicase RecG, partial [Firmicutes bacterium]|nr:ATP-dependent DNA helicase RecG [Bacillota bacterium]
DESLEVLDESIREANGLCGIEYALKNIHYPEDDRHMRVSKYRLIFEELLLFGLGILMMKNKFLEGKAGYVMSKKAYEKEFCRDLPFKLTSGQQKAIDDICGDMSSGKRMNRLIQGDVGSGKTVVSAAAAYKAIKNGYQAVIMAPTEILAYQHFETFKEFFKDKDITVKILTSSISAKERKETLEMCEDGRADLIIGTHAVFGKDVKFKELALVVTDEQHRFGVAQREALNEKGTDPHVMVMTATPIPRTLALIMYGDMDVSVINDKPLGRKEIITRVFRGEERETAYKLVMDQVKKDRQAYIVTPLIESSENMDVRSSEEVFEEAKAYFGEYKTALLHGKMKQEEKDRIMNDFKEGNIQVLVSTVIIEVGINVPNATVMVIENSERFGLAQMHQLRGRVGRGSEQSFCLLVLDKETDVAVKRAEAMESCSDGFVIAEKDLALRGTGEFFGTRQHGIPDMRIADVVKHSKILKKAMEEAGRIIEKDCLLESEENIKMKERIFSLYGERDPGL